jgi:hypothetical protein
MRSVRRTETLSLLFLVSSVGMLAQSASPQKPPPQPAGDTVTVMLPGTPRPPSQDPTAPEGKPEWRRAGGTVPSVGAPETRKPFAPASLGGEIARQIHIPPYCSVVANVGHSVVRHVDSLAPDNSAPAHLANRRAALESSPTTERLMWWRRARRTGRPRPPT